MPDTASLLHHALVRVIYDEIPNVVVTTGPEVNGGAVVPAVVPPVVAAVVPPVVPPVVWVVEAEWVMQKLSFSFVYLPES